MKSTPTSAVTRHEACCEICDRLLRGEMGAVEVYGLAIRKFESEPAAGILRQIRAEHERAVDLLRANIVELGGTPSTDAGAWGAMARPRRIADIFSESSILKNLQLGEERGCADYQSALKDEATTSGGKELIRFELQPGAERNIASLQSLSSITHMRAEFGDGLSLLVSGWR